MEGGAAALGDEAPLGWRCVGLGVRPPARRSPVLSHGLRLLHVFTGPAVPSQVAGAPRADPAGRASHGPQHGPRAHGGSDAISAGWSEPAQTRAAGAPWRQGAADPP